MGPPGRSPVGLIFVLGGSGLVRSGPVCFVPVLSGVNRVDNNKSNTEANLDTYRGKWKQNGFLNETRKCSYTI